MTDQLLANPDGYPRLKGDEEEEDGEEVVVVGFSPSKVSRSNVPPCLPAVCGCLPACLPCAAGWLAACLPCVAGWLVT